MMNLQTNECFSFLFYGTLSLVHKSLANGKRTRFNFTPFGNSTLFFGFHITTLEVDNFDTMLFKYT
jgi:hypothetical protein